MVNIERGALLLPLPVGSIPDVAGFQRNSMFVTSFCDVVFKMVIAPK